MSWGYFTYTRFKTLQYIRELSLHMGSQYHLVTLHIIGRLGCRLEYIIEALSLGANMGHGPKYSSTSSDHNIKTMLLANILIILKI